MRTRVSTFVSLLALGFAISAQSADFRTTRKGQQVAIKRVPRTLEDKLSDAREERNVAKLYADPSFRIVTKSSLWNFARNCHDFAFAPFMSCCPFGPLVPQAEAAVMDLDPQRFNGGAAPFKEVSRNWRDGTPSSMVNVLTSLPLVYEYTFIGHELTAVRQQFTDSLGRSIGLPACPLNNLTSDEPNHSGILIGTIEVDDNRLVGMYWSKWGKLGLYQHRWGHGYVPPEYMRTLSFQPGFLLEYPAQTLRIFAPSGTAPGGGGWNIVHSAWGLGSPPESTWPQ